MAGSCSLLSSNEDNQFKFLTPPSLSQETASFFFFAFSSRSLSNQNLRTDLFLGKNCLMAVPHHQRLTLELLNSKGRTFRMRKAFQKEALCPLPSVLWSSSLSLLSLSSPSPHFLFTQMKHLEYAGKAQIRLYRCLFSALGLLFLLCA